MLRVGTSKEKGKKSSLKRIPKQTQGSPVRGHFRVEAEGLEGAWRLVCLGCPNATLHRIGLDVFCLRGPSKTSQAPWLLRHQASDLGLHPEVLATRIGPCGQGRGHTQGLGGGVSASSLLQGHLSFSKPAACWESRFRRAGPRPPLHGRVGVWAAQGGDLSGGLAGPAAVEGP